MRCKHLRRFHLPLSVFDTNLGVGGTLPATEEVGVPIQPLIATWTGWVQRWSQWVEARVTGWCEAGTRYKVEFLQATGEIAEMLVFPNKFLSKAEGT